MSFFRRNKKDSPKPQPEAVDWEKIIERTREMQIRFPWNKQWVVILNTKQTHKLFLVLVIGILGLLIWSVIKPYVHNYEPQHSSRNQINLDSILKQEKKEVIPNYSVLKRQALDSLIDNKIFTVENIQKIDSIYPDSLCDCK